MHNPLSKLRCMFCIESPELYLILKSFFERVNFLKLKRFNRMATTCAALYYAHLEVFRKYGTGLNRRENHTS